MQKNHNNKGFSLSEVLMATAILAIGLVFIAGTFPVGISLTAATVERTTAAVVADEAFAKISFLGVDDDWPKDAKTDTCTAYEDAAKAKKIGSEEFAYPSLLTTLPSQYCWSALCRPIPDVAQRLVQVTVFVSRKVNPALKYPYPTANDLTRKSGWPKPVQLPCGTINLWWDKADPRFFTLQPPADTDWIISAGATILNDQTGQLYRVESVDKVVEGSDVFWVITLDRPWNQPNQTVAPKFWVVPPPVGGGRYPVIGIYQKIIKF
jgi:prepilin-type N-terminal cleavage/methylation domain-containing protein